MAGGAVFRPRSRPCWQPVVAIVTAVSSAGMTSFHCPTSCQLDMVTSCARTARVVMPWQE